MYSNPGSNYKPTLKDMKGYSYEKASTINKSSDSSNDKDEPEINSYDNTKNNKDFDVIESRPRGATVQETLTTQQDEF